MSRFRKTMSKKYSKKVFKKNTGIHPRNVAGKSMRGGTRL